MKDPNESPNMSDHPYIRKQIACSIVLGILWFWLCVGCILWYVVENL